MRGLAEGRRYRRIDDREAWPIEPVFTLVRQSISWSVAYAIFALLCAATALVTAQTTCRA